MHGCEELARLEVEFSQLRSINDTVGQSDRAMLLPMAVRLFGVEVLADTALAGEFQELELRKNVPSGDSSGSGCRNSS